MTDVLLELALELGATRETRLILPLVLDRVTTLLDAERALVALLNSEGKVYDAVVHNLEWAGAGTPLPISQGVVRKAIEERRPVIVANTADDRELGARESVAFHGLRCMVGMPLVRAPRLLGVLYVDSRAHALDDVEARVTLLEGIAALVALALENARLAEEQRFRNRLLASTMHEVRTPMAALASFAATLGRAPMDLDATARDMRTSLTRIRHLVDAGLALARAEDGRDVMLVERIDLVAEIARFLSSVDAMAEAMGHELATPDGASIPPVMTGRDALWVVLDNLVFNALKHTPRGERIHIALAVRDDAGPASALRLYADDHLFRRAIPLVPARDARFVEVTVESGGPPIPEALASTLFTAFARGSPAQAGHQGSGLGLSIVDQCVRHLGGRVWLDTAVPRPCFRFTLPTRIDLAVPPA